MRISRLARVWGYDKRVFAGYVDAFLRIHANHANHTNADADASASAITNASADTCGPA